MTTPHVPSENQKTLFREMVRRIGAREAVEVILAQGFDPHTLAFDALTPESCSSLICAMQQRERDLA